jgi:hypothetical protein
MPGQQRTASDTIYLRIVGGELVQKVAEGTKDSRCRKYEHKEGEAHELVYMNWTGKVQSVEVKEGNYGEECIIKMEDAQLTLPTIGRYFSDFAKKIHQADLSKPVTFHPFDWEVDGERRIGIKMYHVKDEPFKNYFYDPDKKKSLHGFPEVDKSKADRKSYWNKYYIDVAEFLAEYLDELKFPEIKTTLDEVAEDLGEKTEEVPKTKKVIKSKEEVEKELTKTPVDESLPWEDPV